MTENVHENYERVILYAKELQRILDGKSTDLYLMVDDNRWLPAFASDALVDAERHLMKAYELLEVAVGNIESVNELHLLRRKQAGPRCDNHDIGMYCECPDCKEN